LRQAKLTIEQAVKNLEVAESDGGKLGLLTQQQSLAEANLNQLRAAVADP